jgi:hypothetical protein
MTKSKPRTAQLRLLLPQDWIAELDNLAASRFLTRLGLIRFYLRLQMDDDLSQLAEHYKQTEENKRTHQRLSRHLQDYER